MMVALVLNKPEKGSRPRFGREVKKILIRGKRPFPLALALTLRAQPRPPYFAEPALGPSGHNKDS